MENLFIYGAIGLGILACVLWAAWDGEKKDKTSALNRLDKLEGDVLQIIASKANLDKQVEEIEKGNKQLKKYEDDLNALIAQRGKGFPLLGEVYAEYCDIQGKILENHLKYKDRPAVKAAEAVKEITKEKRELYKELKVLQYKIKNYELLAPFLTEVEEVISTEDDAWLLSDYSEEEIEDETTRYLTKEEYRKLTASERNQLALDRYWSRGKKSHWLVGKMYEHYIGYLYERDGWDVEYFGITERYEDFGRDLIAKKENIVHIVQCKNWSKYKTIYENHIFQLFGTTFEYQKENPSKKVSPVFFSSTHFSDAAREFANRLGILARENVKLEQYPCIKCNISSKDKSKIYHLPFDLQYDKAIIEPKKGEFYAMTVKEAEEKGFRRSYRWHPTKT